MEMKLIERYNISLEKLGKIINMTSNSTLKNSLRETFIVLIKDLAIIEKNNINHYIEWMSKVGIENDIINKTVEEIEAKQNGIDKEKNENSEIDDVTSKEEQNDRLETAEEDIEKNKDEIDLGTDDNNSNEKETQEVNNSEKDKIEPEINEDDKKEQKNNTTKVNKNTDTNEILDETPLKIVGIKKANSKPSLGLCAVALLGVGAAVNTFSLPVIAISAYVLYKLYKKKKISDNKYNVLLEANGFKISDKGELLDRNGEVITEQKVGKENYELIKKQLLELNLKVENGKIRKMFKLNRLKSLLMNCKNVKKIEDYNNKLGEKYNNYIDLESEEIEEAKKGMGRVK